MRSSLRHATLATLGVVCAAAALGPSTAGAATVTRDPDGTIVYTAAPGERNRVGVGLAYDGVGFVLYDAYGAIQSAPADCVLDPMYSYDNQVICPAQPPAVRLDLGDGDDNPYVDYGTNVPVTMLGGPGRDDLALGAGGGMADGGPGDDTLTGLAGEDVLRGGDGNDTLDGGAANDQLDGGAGDDLLAGDRYEGQFTDVIDGGPGFDRIEADWSSRDYDYVQPPVTVTLGGGADDGRPGEQDNVRGIEQIDMGIPASVTGTDVAETIKFHQTLTSMTLDGKGGDDTLQAGEGADVVRGGAGNDTVDGSFGDDEIDPGPGRDTVYGDLKSGDCGPYWCKLTYGNDTILARDGEVDSITCGAGADRVVADADDVVASDCETVERAGGPQPGPQPGPVADGSRSGGRAGGGGRDSGRPARGSLKPVKARLRTALAHGLIVRVTGLRPRARVVLTARSGRKTVARGSARANATGKATITLRFTPAARRSLRHARRARLTVTGAGRRGRVVLVR
jgi:hypothetical protein